MLLLCFLHLFCHLVLLLHHGFIVSFFKYLCFKFIKTFEYLVVQETNLSLDLLDVETFRELLPYVFPDLLDDLRVHPIVVGIGIVQTALIHTHLHAIIHKECVFVRVIQKECRVVKSLRYRLTEMCESLLNVSHNQLLILYVIAISLHLSLHVLNKIPEFREYERYPEIFH